MAYLQLNYPSIVRGLHREFYWRNQTHHVSLAKGRGRSRENSEQKLIRISWRRDLGRREKGLNVQFLQCSSTASTSSSSAEELEVAAGTKEAEGSTSYAIQRVDQSGLLASEHGWQVRRMAETEAETKTVARVQAEAFHEPVVLFDDMFFDFFQAEVLSGLLYRLRNSPPERYACLVAEPFSASGSEIQDLVGVVDCTVQRDDDVLQHLPGADEYLYVSGIAVLRKFRRQKVATALLKACDMLSVLWGFEDLVLRAYEDDWGARKLYSNAGYRVVGGDPAWMSTWIGRRRRVLMTKRCHKNSDKTTLAMNSANR